jgi:hypothetical protein
MIAEVQRYGGSVVSFSGDAITCWFDDQRANDETFEPSNTSSFASFQAVASALDVQRVL